MDRAWRWVLTAGTVLSVAAFVLGLATHNPFSVVAGLVGIITAHGAADTESR